MTILNLLARSKSTVKHLFFGGLLLLAQNSFAQTNSVSPLSISGLGETSFGITPTFLGLGGTGIAYADRYTINMYNPAGYTNMYYTTLEMSGAHRMFRHEIETDGVDQDNYNTYFDYFGFGFKFNDYFAGAFSISPYAAKGYNISVADSSDDFGVYEYRSLGQGGFDQFKLGLAAEPVKWFSIGANMNYIFGETTQSNKTIIADNSFLSVSKTQKNGISDFNFDFGTQFKFKLGSYKINAGAIYALGGAMNARQISTQYSFINSGIVETPVDTLNYNLAENGTFTLPSSYGAGISFSKDVVNSPINAWDFVADYRVTNFSEYRGFVAENASVPPSTLSNSERISAGFAFVPAYAISSLKRNANYFAIARYRLGASTETGQYQWNTEPYTTREVNMGMSFPIVYRSLAPGEQKASFLNISIGRGQRWDGSASSLKETYWNFNLGMTLNDKWFQQFKYR